MKTPTLILAVVVVMSFMFASCGDDDDENNVNNTTNNSNNTNNANNANNTTGTNNANNQVNNINNTTTTSETNNQNNVNNTNSTVCVPDPDAPECSNCIDDDGDGFIDGMDPGCISPDDRLEGSFETDIPGDDTNTTTHDCWFDGNSGGGDDGCQVHVCCLLDDCPAEYQSSYDPSTCVSSISQECVDNCDPFVVPGCDCFGCCTVCEGSDCYNIFIGSPRISPNCTQDTIDDPDMCPRCTPREECGAPCDPENCILCPGQTEEDLPPECTGETVCPDEQLPCEATADCGSGYYCATGCCIPIPNVSK